MPIPKELRLKTQDCEARHEVPWVKSVKNNNHKGIATRGTHPPKPKPHWGFAFLIRCPSVTRDSPVLRSSGPHQSEADLEAPAEDGQPWAFLRNPFGIPGEAN